MVSNLLNRKKKGAFGALFQSGSGSLSEGFRRQTTTDLSELSQRQLNNFLFTIKYLLNDLIHGTSSVRVEALLLDLKVKLPAFRPIDGLRRM